MSDRRLGQRKLRTIRETLLIVGEGNAEVEVLRLIKRNYLHSRIGPSLTIANARGRGALNVINTAIRNKKRADFNQVGALFDTDTDWNDKALKRARTNGIVVLPCSPCLEAVLLDIADIRLEGSTAQQKSAFRRQFGLHAHEVRVMDNFSRAMIDEARGRVQVVNDLLNLIGIRQVA